MAGSASSVSSTSYVEFGHGVEAKRMQKVVISWTADDANGSVPNLSLSLKGYLIQAVTNPGSTAPTDNYDLVINDADGADICGGALANRDTANSECVVFNPAPFADGSQTVVWSNNSVNSATGTLTLYVSDTR